MEYWLTARKFVIVSLEDVNIKDFALMEHQSSTTQNDDDNIPHLLQRCCDNTISVRVAAPYNKNKELGKQFFLLVRSNLSSTFAKSDIMDLCDHFLKLANCIIIANGILTQTYDTIRERSKHYRRAAEIINRSDIAFDKLRFIKNAQYRILCEEEAKQIEERLKTKVANFPRMLVTDPIARYYGFRPGYVLEVQKQGISYRVVTFHNGLLPPHLLGKETAAVVPAATTSSV